MATTEELLGRLNLDKDNSADSISAKDLNIITSDSVNNQLSILRGDAPPVFPDKEISEEDRPSNLEGFELGLKTSGIAAAGRAAVRKVAELTDAKNFPDLQEQPDDWSPISLEAVQNVPHKYWEYIFSATSKRQQELRQSWAMDDAKEEQDYQNSPSIASFTGAAIGFYSDAWAVGRVTGIPLFSHQRLSNNYAVNVFGNVGINSAKFGAYELGKQQLNNYTDFKEVATNTAFAAILDLPISAFESTPKTLKELFRFSNSKEVFEGAVDAVNFDVEINPDNSLGRRVPASSEALSAKKRTGYQQFADSAIVRDNTILNNGFLNYLLKISPQYRGLTSESATITSMTNKLTPHNFITKNLQHSANQFTYTAMMDVANNRARLTKSLFKKAYKESSGAKAGVTQEQALKSLEENINKGTQLSEQDWNKQAFASFSAGAEGIDNAMNSIMKFTKDEIQEVFDTYKQSNNSIKEYISPVTQAQYTSRHYNMIESDRVPFTEDVATEWKKQDAIISNLTRNVDSLSAQIAELEQRQLSGQGTPKENVEKIEDMKEHLKVENDKLDAKLRDNPEHHILLHDLTHLTSDEAEQLKALHAPLNDLKESKLTIEKEIKDLNKSLSSKTQSAKKAKTERTREARIAEINSINEELELKRQERLQASLKVTEEEKNLADRAKGGEINANLFFTKADREIIWKDAETRPKLRKPFEDDEARMLAAEDVFDTITAVDFDNNSFNSSAMKKFTGNKLPNSTISRSLMIPDSVFIKGNYIHTNLADMLNMYRNSLTKRTAINELFPAGDFDEGIVGIRQSLKKEREEALKKARQQLNGKEQLKAVNKIAKKFTKNLKFANTFWDAVVNPTRAGQMSQLIRNYIVATKLGSVVFSYLPDIAGNIFQNGLSKAISSHIKVLADTLKLKSLPTAEKNSMIDTGAGNLQYATLRTNRLSDEVLGGIDPKGPLTNAVDISEKFGHKIMNLGFANAAENQIRNAGVLVSQSEIIRKLNDFKKGVISDKDLIALRQIGIEPSEWSTRIMQQVEKYGSGSEKEGWGANHPAWDDIEAKRAFNLAVTTIERLTTTNSMSVQAPFIMNSNAAKPFTQFSSFVFNSFYNHMVPSAQYLTSERAQGLLAYVVLGAMVGPLYRMASGREPIESESQFARDTMAYAGLLGPFWDYAVKADGLIGTHLIQDEKRRFRGVLGEFGGPAVGLADSIRTSVKNLTSGKGTQRDVVNTAGLSGITGLWELRWLVNKGASLLGFPEKRTKQSKASKI